MKTINIVNKIVATNLNLDVKTVEKVNKLYWKELVRNLTTLADLPVHIKKIGTIVASPYKTNNYIKYLLNKIKKVKASPKYTDQTKDRIVAEIKVQISNLWKKRDQFATEFYNNRKQQRR